MNTQTAAQRKAALEAQRKLAANSGTVTPPAMAAKGTRENPWGDDIWENGYKKGALDIMARFAGHYVKLDNGKVFALSDKGAQSWPGRWGKSEETGSPVKGAARLASLANGSAIARKLEGESETDFSARSMQVEIGNLMARAVASKINVKLAAVQGGKVKRALSIAEKQDRLPGIPVEILAGIDMHCEVEIPAQAAGEVLLSQLSPLATLAEGEESRVMKLLATSPGSAFRASA